MPWILKRVGTAILLIWVVITIVFLAIRMVPGDPAELLLTQGGISPDPATVAMVREQLGLDVPFWQQYVQNLGHLATGYLGISLRDEAPVADEILIRLPRTLELIGAAAVISILIGIPAGVAAALRRGGLFDRLASAVSGLALSVPVFVIGTVLVLVFAQWLRLVPAGGYVPLATDPVRHFTLLMMPAVSIGVGLAAIVMRMTRASVLDVMLKDYVRTAKAKGVAPRRIVVRHILRNALIPVVTVLGLHLGSLLGGTVLVEFVFNYPGLSGLLVDSVNARDYPMVEGVILVISVLFVALNLVMDLIYAALDPRVRNS
ncbi:ABC transporter permease [Acetobacteraceae bacterium H6797]|nr:ABC transporter permease [Acetobacteraceae bacterium H6797]